MIKHIVFIKLTEEGKNQKDLIVQKLENLKNDIDFEDQKFSDLFFVRAKPEKFGYDFFTPRMMEFFLKYHRSNLVVKGNVIMLYNFGGVSSEILLPQLRRGGNPFESWMRTSEGMLSSINDLIPKYMLQRSGVAREGRVFEGTRIQRDQRWSWP